jgi:hypothetical protein
LLGPIEKADLAFAVFWFDGVEFAWSMEGSTIPMIDECGPGLRVSVNRSVGYSGPMIFVGKVKLRSDQIISRLTIIA